MYLFHLEKEARIAIRASGTEPKVKFYFFARTDLGPAQKFAEVKDSLVATINEIWKATQADVHNRTSQSN